MSRSRSRGSEIAFDAPEAVLDASPDAIFTTDADGAIIYMNPAAEEMFALERGATRGKPLSDVVPGDLEDKSVGARRETNARRSDGAQFPIEITLIASRETPLQYTAFIRDLSVIKEEERRRNKVQAILSRAERVVGMGSYELDIRTREITWSDEMFRIYGFEPGEVEPTLELALSLVHPADQESVEARIAAALDSQPPQGGRFRIRRNDGTVRHVVSAAAIENDDGGDPLCIVGTLRDITADRMLERDLDAHHALTRALTEWDSFEEGVVDLLRRLGTAMDWDMGAIWVRAPQRNDLLVARAFWADPAADLGGFEQQTRQMSYERGVGGVWKVWEEQRPYNVVDVASDETISETPARQEAVQLGIGSAILFPAVHDGETLAVLSFAGTEPRVLTDRLLGTLESLGRDVGRFLARRRSEIGLQKLSNRELQVLQLAADGLSAPQVAQQLAIGPATVKTHFTHVYRKLGVTDRPAAVAEAMRQGLIE